MHIDEQFANNVITDILSQDNQFDDSDSAILAAETSANLSSYLGPRFIPHIQNAVDIIYNSVGFCKQEQPRNAFFKALLTH